jgi:hypothetical protein
MCPQCGDPDWDKEFEMPGVSPKREYYVIGDWQDAARVQHLDLWGVQNIGDKPSAMIPHRLKDTWRKLKMDNLAKSGTELIVVLDKPKTGPNAGKWVFNAVKRQRDPAARACQVHTWGLFAGLTDYDWNRPVHVMYTCTCEKKCALCSVAIRFAEEKNKPNWSVIGMTLITQLRDTALADTMTN